MDPRPQLPIDVLVNILAELAWDGEDRAFHKLAHLCCNSADLAERSRKISRPLVVDIHVQGSVKEFSLPIKESKVVNVCVHWGDGVVEEYKAPSDVRHAYLTPGRYRVRVCARSVGSTCLDQFGYSYQRGPAHLWYGRVTKFISLGKLGITSLAHLFAGMGHVNPDISKLCVGDITDMSYLFQGSSFAGPIGAWDVSNVVNMQCMFAGAVLFNQPIGNWNVGNVVNMRSMFASAHSFNQPIGDWNVANVVEMSKMFCYAGKFNQPIGNWNVGKVKTMRLMFSEASEFNQPIENWNIENVKSMAFMFDSAHKFNQAMEKWVIDNVDDMEGMFRRAVSFWQPIGKWNLRNVKLNCMFEEAYAFRKGMAMLISSNRDPSFMFPVDWAHGTAAEMRHVAKVREPELDRWHFNDHHDSVYTP